MPDQDDADDHEEQAGDSEPDTVQFPRVEDPDQVEDAGEDHQHTEQDGNQVQRSGRVKGDDEPENEGKRPDEHRRLPRTGQYLRRQYLRRQHT